MLIISEGGESLDFGRVRKHGTKTMNLIVKNPGNIPATALIRCSKSTCFKVQGAKEYSLMPKETKTFTIEFNPETEEVYNDILKIDTLCNPYEKFKIDLLGQGYFDILSFDSLSGKADILFFQDIVLTQNHLNSEPLNLTGPMQILSNGERIIYDTTLPAVIHDKLAIREITIKNYSNNCVRFNWVESHPVITVKPSEGHIAGLSTKKFMVRLINKDIHESIVIDSKLEMMFQEIEPASEDQDMGLFEGWDNTKRIRSFVDQETLKTKINSWISKNPPLKNLNEELQGENKEGLYEVFSMLEQPPFADIETASKEPAVAKNKKPKVETRSIAVQVKAFIDTPKIKCDIETINFASTMMYSERIFSFKVANLSKIALPLTCKFINILNENVDKEDEGYFSVTPSQKILEKESENEILIKFQPLECNEVTARKLLLCLPEGT